MKRFAKFARLFRVNRCFVARRKPGPDGREGVVVLGNLELGPKAEVHDITVVAGAIEQDPEALVAGSFTEVPIYIPFIADGWEAIHHYIYQRPALGRFIVTSIERS